MKTHVLIQDIDIHSLLLPPEYREWLTTWLRTVDEDIERGDIAASLCFQACLCEQLLLGELKHDWRGVFDEYLTGDSGEPLAYTESFGKRLYGFSNQWRQTPVHAVYTRYWFDSILGTINQTIGQYTDLIESLIQPDGWIYNPKVSETQLRTRMRSELFMSLAMGVEILAAAGRLDRHKTSLVATLAATPVTGYLSAEYFRAVALTALGSTSQIPAGLFPVIEDCQAGQGYSDFAVKNKVDDYMGTAKRTSRDVALHSPLASVHALHLSSYTSSLEQAPVRNQVQQFAAHLEKDPLDIPAFHIRDFTFAFGTDISPIEIVCAAWIRQHFANRKEL